MNIAYLILAHHQPALLQRLVRALAGDGVHFFVHVDAKADHAGFAGIIGPNLTMLKNPVRVHWAGFSQLTAMLRLIDAALATRRFDYYVFLSGVDYPIKGNRFIHDFFAQHQGTTFMNFYRVEADAPFAHHLIRRHRVDMVSRLPRPLSLGVRIIVRIANVVLPARKFVKGLVPYRGSTSWCLQHEDVAYVTHFVDTATGRKLLRFLRGAFSPDEILFPTAILNSPLANHCRFFERDSTNAQTPVKTETRAFLHYIDWSSGRENPAILTMSDLAALRQSPCLFARKFDERISAALLEAIDRELLRGEEG